MEKFKGLQGLLNSAEKDAVSFFEKGNKLAGRRLRAVMLQLKTVAAEIRKEVTERKKLG